MITIPKNRLQGAFRTVEKDRSWEGPFVRRSEMAVIVTVYDSDYTENGKKLPPRIERATGERLWARVRRLNGQHGTYPFVESQDTLYGLHGDGRTLVGRVVRLTMRGNDDSSGTLTLGSDPIKKPAPSQVSTTSYDIGGILG